MRAISRTCTHFLQFLKQKGLYAPVWLLSWGESFRPPFLKGGTSPAPWSAGRRPQAAKFPIRRFLFAVSRSETCFSLCTYMVKEKAFKKFVFIGGNEPFVSRQSDSATLSADSVTIYYYNIFLWILQGNERERMESYCEFLKKVLRERSGCDTISAKKTHKIMNSDGRRKAHPRKNIQSHYPLFL